MWRLDEFAVDELEKASEVIRDVGDGATSMEAAAGRVARTIQQCMVGPGDEPVCPLVRLYATHPVEDLDGPRRAFAGDAAPGSRCLTLLGTAGTDPAWNDALASKRHLAIPLGSPSALASFPMVSRLFEQLGFDPAEVVDPDPDDTLKMHHRSYQVFHVEEAVGSPWVPAQDFVEDHGIRSVVGLGGALPSGDLIALLMFSSVTVDRRTAQLLRSLAPAVKASVVGFTYRMFAEHQAE